MNVGEGTFTLSTTTPISGNSASLFFLAGNVSSGASGTNNVYLGRDRTVASIDGYVTIGYRTTGDIYPSSYQTMLNSGPEALPYEPYSSEVWHDTPYYIRKTDTDILTLPQTIYSDGTNATLTLKGNTGGVGDLVTEGEHVGEYVIPITNNGVTTNVYNATALDVSDTLTTSIPTTDGANSLSVDTTVQPSEVTATYHGWHNKEAKEYTNGSWQ